MILAITSIPPLIVLQRHVEVYIHPPVFVSGSPIPLVQLEVPEDSQISECSLMRDSNPRMRDYTHPQPLAFA